LKRGGFTTRTNGYIQGNKFFIKHKTGRIAENTKRFEPNWSIAGVTRKPNQEILEGDSKCQIELKLIVREKRGKKMRERVRKNGCCFCFGEEDECEREREIEKKKWVLFLF
jgi:hypothetical protein